MKREFAWGAVLLATGLLAGCDSSPTVIAGSDGSFSVNDGRVVLHSPDGNAAEIAADGSFTIDGKPVTVTDAQRATLVRYHDRALTFIDHAKDTGKAGAAVGVAAAKEVANGLAGGDTAKIGAKIEAEAGQVKAAAGRMCEDLAAIADLQTSLSSDLAAFRPYAVIRTEDASKCRKDVADAPGKS